MNFEKKLHILDDTASLASFTSRISPEKLDRIIDQSKSNRIQQITKLVFLIVCPIAALIALSGILLYVSFQTANQMQRAEVDINFIIEMAQLVEEMEDERGTTASWISIGGIGTDYHSMVAAR